jgi:hypothetical protein
MDVARYVADRESRLAPWTQRHLVLATATPRGASGQPISRGRGLAARVRPVERDRFPPVVYAVDGICP